MIEAVMYWLRHLGGEEGIFNYITSHTGFTLNDLVSVSYTHLDVYKRQVSVIKNDWSL